VVTSRSNTEPVDYDEQARTGRLLVLQSHNSIWMFDEVDHVYGRIRPGSPEETPLEWRSYDRLIFEPDSDAFLVFLDAAGTRLLRGRRHVEQCDECELTQEFSVEELRALTRP